MDTYIGGGLELVQKVTSGMTERGFGRFVFIGTSYLFNQPPENVSSYIIANSALQGNNFKHGVASLAVTNLSADISLRMKQVEARKNPIRRLASVTDDTAEAVAYLVGEQSSFVIGVNLPVTGAPVQKFF